jgi:prepilin peptidase CpaA
MRRARVEGAIVSLFAFQSVFVLCVCYTIVSDFRNLRIPNWIILVLIGAFAVFAAVHLEVRTALVHLALAVVILLLASAFFVANWIAGGDVKFLAATILWMGPEFATHFTMLMAVVGALLAMALMGIRNYPFLVNAYLPDVWVLRRMTTLAERGQCPYGVAIGIAALLAPSSLSL